MLCTVGSEMTARRSTSQNSAILSRVSAVTGWSLRQRMTSGWMPMRAQLPHGVLRRLRLQLARGADVRQEGHVDRERVLRPLLAAHLADRLEERLALDVADGAADLDDHDLRAGDPADAADARLDLVA